MLDIGQLPAARPAGAQYAHGEQLLEHKVLVLAAEVVGGLKGGDLVGQLAQRAGEAVVLCVVVALLDAVAAHNGMLAVIVVGLVGTGMVSWECLWDMGFLLEVDLAEELLLMMLEFATHGAVRELAVRCVS